MRRWIYIAVGILSCADSIAQPPDAQWSRTYGGDRTDGGRSIVETVDGGYLIAGNTSTPSSGTNILVVRTNSQGDSLWCRNYGGSGSENCNDVLATSDGSFLLAGTTTSFGSGGYDFWLLKIDSMGDSLWSRTYGGSGGEFCYAIRNTYDGGYALVGSTNSFGAGGADFWLVLTNGSGDSLLSETFGSTGDEVCRDVCLTPEPGYLLIGSTDSFGSGDDDVWVVSVDSDAFIFWDLTIGTSSYESGVSVVATQDSSFAVLAQASSPSGSGSDVLLLKVSYWGDSIWSSRIAGLTSYWPRAFSRAADGGYVVAGNHALSGGLGYDYFLLKLSEMGDSLWCDTYDRELIDWCFDVELCSDDSYILAGESGPWLSDFQNEFWVVKTETDDSPSRPEIGRLIGVARTTEYLPLDSVVVMLSPGSRRDTTDAQGQYLIDAIPPGQYLLTATRTGYVSKDTLVAIAAGSVTNVNLVLNERILVTVNALDENSAIISDAVITMYDAAHQAIDCVYVSGTGRDDPLPGQWTFETFFENDVYFRGEAPGRLFRYTDMQTFNSTPEHIIPIPLPRIQLPEVTYLFLIRGVDVAIPPYLTYLNPNDEDDGEELWRPLMDAASELFDDNLRVFRLRIAPAGGFGYNAWIVRQQIDSILNHDGQSNPRIVLIGHSMGGIIARHYVAYGNHPVSRIFTIDSPHEGSWWADEIRNVNMCGNIAYSFQCPVHHQLTTDEMDQINRQLYPYERSKSTEYVLISSKFHLDYMGDFIVSVSSQRASRLFQYFPQRVRRPRTFSCSTHELCGLSCFAPYSAYSHSCVVSDPVVINYLLVNLNVPISSINQGSSLVMTSDEPRPSTIYNRTGTLSGNALLSDTIQLPTVSFVEMIVAGVLSASSFALHSPSGMLVDDSASFANIGARYSFNEAESVVEMYIPTPESGNWVIDLINPNPDSITVVCLAMAPIPFAIIGLDASTVLSVGDNFPIRARVTTVSGLTIDSLTAEIHGEDTIYHLNDSNLDGDEVSSDGVWSATIPAATEPGDYMVEFVAYAHAGTEQYRVQSSMNYSVQYVIATISGVETWMPVDADSNDLDEQLQVPISISVDSAARFQISATLTNPTGEFITATQVEDSLEVGTQSLIVAFDGKDIADHHLGGPYVLHDVRLNRIRDYGISTLEYHDSLAASPSLSYAQFEGRPSLVDNVGAVRSGSMMECFWTPHNDPDIEYFKVYYDTDGQPPYEGTGLAEGASPVNAGNGLSFAFSGLDSSSSYTIAVTAVDSAGSESDYSLPYTVFALSAPNPVDDLTFMKSDDDYVLNWSSVPSGARYRIETASSVDGPWTAVAVTYSTSYERPIPALDDVLFFRVIAER